MPVDPSKSLHFESWDDLLRWLPTATESQLMTVFVWTGDQSAPPGDQRRQAQVRKLSFEHLVQRTRDPDDRRTVMISMTEAGERLLAAAPSLPAFHLQRLDELTLSVDITKEQNLNDLFAALSTQGIHVKSLRNKANRLEELFLSMLNQNDQNGA